MYYSLASHFQRYVYDYIFCYRGFPGVPADPVYPVLLSVHGLKAPSEGDEFRLPVSQLIAGPGRCPGLPAWAFQ